MKKTIFSPIPYLSLVLLFLVAACDKNSGSGQRVEVGLPGGGVSPSAPGQGPTRANGGVDVGNMTNYLVPSSQVAVSAGQEWQQEENAARLILKAQDGSSITGETKAIGNLISPDLDILEQYLRKASRGQKIERKTMNGNMVLEVTGQDTAEAFQAAIYLINENKNVIVLDADLKKDAIKSGKAILETTRILYQGEAIPNQSTKTVILEARNYENQNNNQKYAYSLMSDCFTYSLCTNGQSTSLAYMNYRGEQRLELGLAGADTGRFVDLGEESKVPYESIRVDGSHLIAQGKNLPLSDIYTMFTPENLSKNQDRIQAKEGHVYLVRTISWPEEDAILKLRVDRLTGKEITLSYEKLTQIPRSTLEKYEAEQIEYNRLHEKPKSTGQVRLYARSVYDSYPYSAFNFEFSSSGKPSITHNTWDLLYDNKPSALTAGRTGSGVASIHLLESGKTLAQITDGDFPNMNEVKNNSRGLPAQKGAIYLIEKYDYSGDLQNAHIRGAVQVLDIDADGKWIDLEFRRILVGPAKDFVQWQSLPIENGIIQTELIPNGGSQTFAYSPFTRTRGDQGMSYYDNVALDYEGDEINMDSRPYKNRGFLSIDSSSFENLTLNQAQDLLRDASVSRDAKITKGKVYLVSQKNYYTNMIFLIRIDEYTPGKSTKISVRDVYKAQAPYFIK